MDEQDSISGVWREALTIMFSYPLATIVPAVVLGAIAGIPTYLIEGFPILDNALTYLTAAFVYYLYLAYAEGITTQAERTRDRIVLRAMFSELRRAIPFVLRVLIAALVTTSIASVATVLLVVPGAWLFTRWSLSTPVICKEDLGALGALRRSNELVRRRFWFVFTTATLAFVLEEMAVHGGALAGFEIFGSPTWGEWIGGSVLIALAMPLAAFTTSVAYSSVARLAKPVADA